MSKITHGGLDQHGKLYSLNGIGSERVNVQLNIQHITCHFRDDLSELLDWSKTGV